MEINEANRTTMAEVGETEKIVRSIEDMLKRTNQGDSIRNHQLNGKIKEPYKLVHNS